MWGDIIIAFLIAFITAFMMTPHTIKLAKKLGAGRETLDDVIDPEVGLILCKKLGEYVEEEEDLAKIYMNKKDISLKEVLDCFEIEEELKVQPKEILDIIK